MDRIKASVATRTIQIALGGVAVSLISIFLPWLTASAFGIKVSYSMPEAFHANPTWFEGVPIILIVGILLTVGLYLFRFPKLALIGIAAMAFVWVAMFMTADEFGFKLGFGAYLYAIALIVCIVMSFLTKKMPSNGPGPNMPGNWNGPGGWAGPQQ